MNILFFVIILGALVFVHELGHFLMAKRAGIRVDEFAIGFPPRLFSWKWGETTYSFNIVPFGGYVKIFGEDPDSASISGPDAGRSLVHKSFFAQAMVMLGGIFFNILFAWMLLTVGYMTGVPASEDALPPVGTFSDVSVFVTDVAPDSPTEDAGLQIGDQIVGLAVNDVPLETIAVEPFIDAIQQPETERVTIEYMRSGESYTAVLVPEEGIVEDSRAVGVSFESLGRLRLPLHYAAWEGLRTTGDVIAGTVLGFGQLITEAFQGEASIDSLTGPVGLVPEIGRVVQFGFAALLWFTAFISISLAVINVVPFPALDGGRLLFLIIEKIKGSRIPPKIVNTTHTIGFFILIGLMILVTYNDILKLL